MTNPIYKIIEIVGTSTESIEAAINNAIEQSTKTLRHLDWFEVIETRGYIENNKLKQYQVTIKLGLRIENENK